MGDAAHFPASPRHLRLALLAGAALLISCGDAATTEPTPVVTPVRVPATSIALLTPFDSASPLVRGADDSLPSELEVQLRDASGQAVRQAGRLVSLDVWDAAGAASTSIRIRRGGSTPTDTAGVARFRTLVLSGTAGTAVLSARVDTLPPVTIPIRLDAGAVSASASAVSVAPDTMTVGGAAQIVVVPMDASGNKRGAGQSLSATLDGGSGLATISAFTFSASDSSYRASVTIDAPFAARAVRTTVNGTTLTIAPRLTGIAAPPPPASPATALRVTVAPGDTTPAFRVTSGSVWSPTSVQLVDATGAAVLQAGVVVTARAVSTAGQPLPDASVTGAGPVSTNAAGIAVFPGIALTSRAGPARMRFDAANLASAGLPLQVVPGALSASRSTLTRSRDSVILDSAITITVTPRDASGSALGSGQVVVLSATGGTSRGTLGPVAYDASDSTYRATFTGTTAGSATTVRATVGGTQLTTSVSVTVTVAPGVVAPSSPVMLAPDTIPVAGVSQLVATPLDAAGAKLGAGQSVTVTLSGGSSIASVGTVTYNAADSSYRAALTGVTAGTATTVTTTVNGVALTATRPLTVIAAAPPPANPATALAITTVPGDTSGAGFDVQSGALMTGTTVVLRAGNGAQVPQTGVAITATAVTAAGAPWAGATITGSGPLSTDASGAATFPSLRVSAPAGSGRIRFTATGLTNTGFPVRVRAGAPSVTASTFMLTGTSVVVGGAVTAVITPRDAQDNKIGAGQTVALTLGTGTSGITIGAVTYTASDSTYRATLTGTTAGTARAVQAAVGGSTLSTSRTVTVTAPVSADITATVNGGSTFEISRYIYGANFINENGGFAGATTQVPFTFNRMGGNRMTAYNWENNYSNAGSDYFYQNDQYMSSSTTPGASVTGLATPTFNRGQAFLTTVPMIGYVAGNACNCNVGTSDADRANRLATHFKVSRASKGSAFTLTPPTNDGFVYQDEFINWFESSYPGRSSHGSAPVFFALDNEPDIWHITHKQINSDLNDNASTPRLQTYQGLADTAAVYAKAIKAVAPNALIFGPATATYTGLSLLGRYPTPDPNYGMQNFTDVYLDRMRSASTAAGRRLLDVFDLHYYPEMGTNNGTIINDFAVQDAAMVEARVQAPRSLWDPSYTDNSWVPGAAGGPLRLIPRIRDQIAAHYPGTKIAITEYFYGRGGDISGGIAQADVLGIFGREGVFAASLWPFAGLNASNWNGNPNLAYAYIFGAFRMFRNFDGAGGNFGDTGLQATTSNIAQSSIYASRTGAGRVVIVAINKTTSAKVTQIALTGVGSPTGAQAYLMQNGTPLPTRQADVAITGGVLTYTMPAMSVTTLALVP